MFCVQCEQTIRTPAGNGCSYAQGMCGKTAETSDLQDLLIASLQVVAEIPFIPSRTGITLNMYIKYNFKRCDHVLCAM